MRKPFNLFAGLTTVMLLLCTLCLTAQVQPEIEKEEYTPVGPTTTMEFEEYIYDFGTIENGTKVTHVFTFTNTGEEPLILLDAKGSCGCTVPKWPREPIAPGETASLTVKFNSTNKRGKRNQKVTITANTLPAQTFLYLQGEVLYEEGRDEESFSVSGIESEVNISPDCFAIYPNPTAELLKLEVKESHLGKSATISIHSDVGQLMAKREIDVIEGTLEFNVSHYPAGTYVAKVQIGKQKPEARCFVVVD